MCQTCGAHSSHAKTALEAIPTPRGHSTIREHRLLLESRISGSSASVIFGWYDPRIREIVEIVSDGSGNGFERRPMNMAKHVFAEFELVSVGLQSFPTGSDVVQFLRGHKHLDDDVSVLVPVVHIGLSHGLVMASFHFLSSDQKVARDLDASSAFYLDRFPDLRRRVQVLSCWGPGTGQYPLAASRMMLSSDVSMRKDYGWLTMKKEKWIAMLKRALDVYSAEHVGPGAEVFRIRVLWSSVSVSS